MAARLYPTLSPRFSLGIELDAMLSTRKLLPLFTASVAAASSYTPTPSSNNAFRPSFRANSFVAAGLVPVYNMTGSLSLRLGGYCFVPLRRIIELPGGGAKYGKWLNSPEVLCETALSYHFPFGGTLAGYVNYSTGNGNGWNVGLSFGIFMLPPKFLR